LLHSVEEGRRQVGVEEVWSSLQELGVLGCHRDGRQVERHATAAAGSPVVPHVRAHVHLQAVLHVSALTHLSISGHSHTQMYTPETVLARNNRSKFCILTLLKYYSFESEQNCAKIECILKSS
jgi:hypothetical protein